ncbi:MAG: hypothetical protein ATN32_08490 [Candidatus Epulonipiscium fishelsonii]|nr:MAG: hypothetical protein ATN32_08490 [Epulopiscium sp. AS2M-Bin002]
MIFKYFIIDVQTEEIVREVQNFQEIIIALNLEMLYIENKEITGLNKFDPINFIFSQVDFSPDPKSECAIIYYKKMVGKNGLKYPCIIELSSENWKDNFKEIAKIIYNLSGKQYKIEMRKFNLSKPLYDNLKLEENVSKNQKEVLKMLDDYYDMVPKIGAETMLDYIKGIELINLELIFDCKKNALNFGKDRKWNDNDANSIVNSIDDLSKFLNLEIHYYIFSGKCNIQDVLNTYQKYSITILNVFNMMEFVSKLCIVYNPKVNQAILICLNTKPLEKLLNCKVEIDQLANKLS